MGLIRREAEKYIRAVAREYAVVSVLGPRQSGKTTLVRSLFPDYDYVNFENPDEYSRGLDIVKSTREAKLDICLSNSFGFGGTNSAVVIKNFENK